MTDTTSTDARPAPAPRRAPRHDVPDHSRPIPDAIASLFNVPDELREGYDAVTDAEAADRIRLRGYVVDMTTDARNLAASITKSELHGLDDFRMNLAETEAADKRMDDLIHEMLLDGTPWRHALHRAKLEIARERYVDPVAEQERRERRIAEGTDPVTGVYDPRMHGPIASRSIIPDMPTGAPSYPLQSWHGLRSSALVHHLASVLFAIRALERDEQLAAAVEAEVQRMLDAAGIGTDASSTPRSGRRWK